MSTLANKLSEAMAVDVWFDSLMMHIRLLDGREINVPLDWFPKLRDAADEQRKKLAAHRKRHRHPLGSPRRRHFH